MTLALELGGVQDPSVRRPLEQIALAWPNAQPGIITLVVGAVPAGYVELNGASTAAYPALAARFGATLPNLGGTTINGVAVRYITPTG